MKRLLFIGMLTLAEACPAVSVNLNQVADNAADRKQQTDVTLAQMILEEYKVVREEINLSLGKRVDILSFGFAAVGALLAGGVAALSREKKEWFAAALLIGVGATLTSFYVVDVWSVETARLQRASYHNYSLELKMKTLFPADIVPIEWEQRVRRDNYYKSLVPADNGTPWIFIIFAISSAGCGLLLFWRGVKAHSSSHPSPHSSSRRWSIAFTALAALLMTYFTYTHTRNLKNLNSQWSRVPTPTAFSDLGPP